MKRICTFLVLCFFCGLVSAQWTSIAGKSQNPSDRFYQLDLKMMRTMLSGAIEADATVDIQFPVLNGTTERFRVKRKLTTEKSLSEKYQIYSFSGNGLDDPEKTIHFSWSPYGFQSMVVKGNSMEFIDQDAVGSNRYRLHPKTGGRALSAGAFLCSTDESTASKFEVSKLINKNKVRSLSAKMSDRKFRTLRIAISTTAEYTAYFGGIPQALAAVNATLTRVNGIFERDFGVQLILQDFPQLIYTNAATDPYSDYSTGVKGSWSLELQNTLTSTIGNAAYDLGHLFGSNGGGGNSGFVGGVCQDDTASLTDLAKGAAYTSPSDGKPQGDTFDIDFVTHEIGHQLGATHTFSYNIESYGTNVEPGSGSTLMSYAGITSADVQAHADDYFHTVSIEQVLNKLASVTCDTETPVANTPPAIAPLPTYTIPKGTAFYLTAQATDAENDPLTYTWEQIDNATSAVSLITGNETTGPIFRSLPPTASPTKYFPRFDRILQGSLTNPSDWESVPLVARTLNFAVTVRDNHPDKAQQQTNSAAQTVVVGNDGPFRVVTTYIYTNGVTPINWEVANTTSAPYNVANVKIDYSTDGTSWTNLAESTPNDGSENFTFPSSLSGQVYVRISALNNIFYAVNKSAVTTSQNCGTSAPTGLTVSYITPASAQLSWIQMAGATYAVRYRLAGSTAWTEANTSQNFINLTGLTEGSLYEYQVAGICSGTVGTYSPVGTFASLSSLKYCTASAASSTEEYISGVSLANISNSSSGNGYTDYSADPSKLIQLTAEAPYTLSVSLNWPKTKANEGVKAWIDFNRDGVFDSSETILSPVLVSTSPVTANFTVPASAVVNKVLKMRVILKFNSTDISACDAIEYGEAEDYAVMVTSKSSSTTEGIVNIYPNPATDYLYVTKISEGSEFKIYDMSGRLIRYGNLVSGKISLSGLTPAGYVLILQDGERREILKFIKK